MNPGRLSKRITIERLKQNKHENGEVIEDYEVVKTVWAEVKPVTGRQFFEAQQINSEISHQVIIRYTPGIVPNMVIKLNERIFEILYIMNFNERNEALQMMCKELIK